MNPRRPSKPIQIGQVTVGGDAPVVVQSMTKTDTRDVTATTRQIRELEDCGCELVRVAVPDIEAAEAISDIKQGISIPLIADIHFDYRLALAALEAGCDGLRLNPGNITESEKVATIVKAARERSVPIRIGLNAGSLPRTANPQLSVARQMVDAALKQIRLLESLDFDLIKVSLKAFDVLKPLTCQLLLKPTRILPPKCPTPCTSALPKRAHRNEALSAAPWASAPCSTWASAIPSGYHSPPTPERRSSLPTKS